LENLRRLYGLYFCLFSKSLGTAPGINYRMYWPLCGRTLKGSWHLL